MDKQTFYLGMLASAILLVSVFLFQGAYNTYDQASIRLQKTTVLMDMARGKSVVWAEPEALAYLAQSANAEKMLKQKHQEVSALFEEAQKTLQNGEFEQGVLLKQATTTLHKKVLKGLKSGQNGQVIMASEGYQAALHSFLETRQVAYESIEKKKKRALKFLRTALLVAKSIAFLGGALLLFLLWRTLKQKEEMSQKLQVYISESEEETFRQKNKERQLQEARHAAEEALMEKTLVLHNISSALKNAISGVISVGDLLLATRQNPKQEDLTRTFLSSAHYLNTTLDDLQDFAEIEAGNVALRQVAFDLHTSLEDVLDLFSAQAYENQVELLLDEDTHLPDVLVGDAARIRQMVAHMANHLLQRLKKGHLLFEIRLHSKNSKKAQIQIIITAQGHGITEVFWDETCATLVEDLYERKSLSLPLLVTRRLADLMQFSIKVRAKNDQQVAITFMGSLPLGEKADQVPVVHAESLKKARIMVLDDHEISQKIITQKLLRNGVRCSSFSSLDHALKAAHQAYKLGDPFHIVLASTSLHATHDREIANAFLSDSLLRDVKLVAMATVAHKGDVKNLTDLGFKGYITKPLRPDEMLSVLEYVFVDDSEKMVTRHTVKEVADDLPVHGKVLLLESDPIHSKITRVFLESQGCLVMEANNSGQAIDLFARQKFDAVVLDVNYQGYLGSQSLVTHLRERERALHHEATPIIGLVSGMSTDEVRAVLEGGVSDFMHRPLTRERVSHTLTRWLPSQEL